MKPAAHAHRKLIPTYLPPFSLHDILSPWRPSNRRRQRPAGHNYSPHQPGLRPDAEQSAWAPGTISTQVLTALALEGHAHQTGVAFCRHNYSDLFEISATLRSTAKSATQIWREFYERADNILQRVASRRPRTKSDAKTSYKRRARTAAFVLRARLGNNARAPPPQSRCSSHRAVAAFQNGQRGGAHLRRFAHHPAPMATSLGRFEMLHARCDEHRELGRSGTGVIALIGRGETKWRSPCAPLV